MPPGSRYVAAIRDIPVPGDVDTSSIQSRGLLLYHCVSLWLQGFGVLVVHTRSFVLSVLDFVPGKTEELIHIFVPQHRDCKTL